MEETVTERPIALDVIPYVFSDPVCAKKLGRERLQSGHADQSEFVFSIEISNCVSGLIGVGER